MRKIVRLTFHRCDRESLIKIQSHDRYALLEYKTLTESLEECLDEMVDFFTSDIDIYDLNSSDFVESLPGPRFSKKGLKDLEEKMYALYNELVHEKPHQITDEFSGFNPNLHIDDPVLE